MTIPTLPEGARLALLNWPGGQPGTHAIADAAGPNKAGRRRDRWQIVNALQKVGLIEARPRDAIREPLTFRLTQAGRKAVDVLQRGWE